MDRSTSAWKLKATTNKRSGAHDSIAAAAGLISEVGRTMNMHPQIDEIMQSFLQRASGWLPPIQAQHIRAEMLSAPHRPMSLPPGWQGIYAFRLGSVWLKVGK